ncbi:MAG: DNA mismatch repair endonuclease MutL [Oscillospiraceae bacterium]
MPKIQVLGKEISELIAAGEVIERPASVIKELIENSIDAGSTVITVEIKNGGIKYMRITDNGSGIPMLDIPTAFLRHATSKISTQADLDNIMTLGFRGEALASIAAVSRVEMTSKTKDEEFGGKFTIEGSEGIELEQVGCSDGTTVIIRDIFYNTPARLKFLKSYTTEGNYIANLVDKMALSHPEISFRFIRDGKQELCTLGNGELYSAVYGVYGGGFAASLIPVDYSSGCINVSGFVSHPSKSRANRVMQMFFVNGRYVKSPILTVSLEEAFKNSIMVGKFPACVLMISINPELVDINVHPAKTEIKFSEDKAVYDAIFFGVKNAIIKSNAENTIVKQTESEITAPRTEISDMRVPPINSPTPQTTGGFTKVTVFAPDEDGPKDDLVFKTDSVEYKSSSAVTDKLPETQSNPQPEGFSFITSESFKKSEKPENTQLKGIEETTADIKFVGEVFKTYIIVEADNEICIIDKHAAHERYIFEQIKDGKYEGNSQLLLFPRKLNLSREEAQSLWENRHAVEKMGFSFSDISDTCIEITGVPPVIGDDECEDVLSEIAENLLLAKKDITPEVLDRLYATISCKSAIKANDKNEEAELMQIARQVLTDERLQYCPHGRPTVVKYTRKNFEKLFNRI